MENFIFTIIIIMLLIAEFIAIILMDKIVYNDIRDFIENRTAVNIFDVCMALLIVIANILYIAQIYYVIFK